MKINLIEIQFVYYFKSNSILTEKTINFYDRIKEKICQNIKSVKFNNLLPIPDQPIIHITDTTNNVLLFQQPQAEQQRCDFIFKEKNDSGNLLVEKFKKTCDQINELLKQDFVINRLGAIATFENLSFENSNEFLNNMGVKTNFNNINMFNLLFEEIIDLDDKKISKYTRFIKATRQGKQFIVQKDFNSGINNNPLPEDFITKFKNIFFEEILK